MILRAETPGDREAIRVVHVGAFATAAEARLVDALRESGVPAVSLVAEVDGEVVGHILLTPVTLDAHPAARLLGLAPLAVAPARQRQGIGAALVRAALARAREEGAAGVVVLGHPDFYSRFGFQPAARRGIACEYGVPEEVFLAIELTPGALAGLGGIARYHEAFGAL